MSITILSHVSAGAAGSGVTTGSIDTSGADLLVAFTMYVNTVTPAPSDSKGNTWRQFAQQDQATNTLRLTTFYSAPTAVVGTGHTFSVTAVNGRCAIAVYALSGCGTVLEKGTTSSATTLGTGNAVLPQRAGLVLTGLGYGGAITGLTPGSGFTTDEHVTFLAANHFGLAIASQLATTGTLTPTWSWTTAVSACAIHHLIFEAGAGSDVVPSAFTFVG